MIHEVKSWPEFFEPISTRNRFHELRLNDRNYQVGDFLLLKEYEPTWQCYTGRTVTAEITSLTSDDNPCAISQQGLSKGYCILSIRKI